MQKQATNLRHEDIFEHYSIPKAVAALAMPTMLGMVVTIIYNLADTFFVGQTGDANQVAAVSLAMPIFMLMMSLGNLFGIGGGTYVSRLLGEKRLERAAQVSSFSFYAGLVVSLVAGVLMLVFLDQLLPLLGTSANTIGFARNYLWIIAAGAVFICLPTVLSQLIRAEGASQVAANGMMIGSVVNIVLDPVMILWLDWGVSGAALATILGNVVAVVYYFRYFRGNTMLSLSPRLFKAETEIMKNVLLIGLAVFINSILMSGSNIIFNIFAVGYGDDVVAAYGVAMRVTSILAMLLMGLSQGITPYLAYHFAAGNYRRMNGCMKFSGAIAVALGLVFLVFGFVFGRGIIQAFIDDTAVIAYGDSILKVLLISAPILGLQFLLSNSFQAFGKPLPSLILSMCRQGLVFLPVLFIGNQLFQLEGIIWAQPISDFVSIFLALLLYVAVYQKEIRQGNCLDCQTA